MRIVKKLKRKIINDNQDIIAVYRILVYSNKNRILELKILRLFIICILFFKKYVLNKNIYNTLNKIESSIPIYQESKISNTLSTSSILKICVESDVIFISICDFLLNFDLDINTIDKSLIDKNYSRIININRFGKQIYDILKSNNKEIVLINDNPKIDFAVAKLFIQNNIDIKVVSTFDKENNIQKIINKIVLTKYKDKKNFVFIGKYFPEKKFKGCIKYIYYENSCFWGEKFRPDKFKNIEQSIYSQLINNKLHNQLESLTKEYEFGFVYGGLITYYLLTEMVKSDKSFEETYIAFKKDIYTYLKENEKKFINALLENIFPKNINNFIYEESIFCLDDLLIPQSLKKQQLIQKGILEFCKLYEEKLMSIKNRNDIDFETVKSFIYFILKNRKKLWRHL